MKKRVRHIPPVWVNQIKRFRFWRLAITLVCALVLLVSGGLAARLRWPPSYPSRATAGQQGASPLPSVFAQKGNAAPDGSDLNQLRQLQQEYTGANGWIWRAHLPTARLVIFYGNPESAPMGPIGQYSDEELMAKLQEQAQVYATLDPSHLVVPALDYVTPVVQPVPMADHSWVYRMPDSSILHYVTLATSHHALFFFDLQVGHSTVQREVTRLWPYLEQPGVDLSLDPEFDLSPGEIPDVEFGQMHAAEVNWVIDQLSHLVQAEHLPPKILIIHRFLQEMLPDWQRIQLKPGVQVIITVDGFGSTQQKIGDYQVYDGQELLPGEFPGMKLFYRLDKPLMSPRDTLALKPSPLMIMYQ